MATPREITEDLYDELHQLASRVTKRPKQPAKKIIHWSLAAAGAATVTALGIAVWKTPTLSTTSDPDETTPKTPPTSP